MTASAFDPADFASGHERSSTEAYILLRRRLQAAGVFERQLRYYSVQVCIGPFIILVSAYLLATHYSTFLALVIAPVLAFAFVHTSFTIHDAGHRQIFASVPWNDRLMLLLGLVIGYSRSWWFETHNRHHVEPNNPDVDPTISLPLLSFSAAQFNARAGISRTLVRLQAFYFFPLLGLSGLWARFASLRFVASGRSRYPLIEAGGILLHVTVYFGALFYALPMTLAITFIVFHQGLVGLYMGMLFAPNHKGLPVREKGGDEPVNFMNRQLVSSRNITPSPILDFFYGGLNYQIEHHLFPSIPRNRLRLARSIVKRFCTEQGLVYNECSIGRSYWEVATHMKRVTRES